VILSRPTSTPSLPKDCAAAAARWLQGMGVHVSRNPKTRTTAISNSVGSGGWISVAAYQQAEIDRDQRKQNRDVHKLINHMASPARTSLVDATTN
jgi:hypothetical protein